MHATVLCRKGIPVKSSSAILCACSFLLVACGPDRAPTPPKLSETQRQALDKATTVNDAVQQQAEQQRQDVDQQSR
ncbi:hypothetical protein GALL_352760 [mine drainage metagenome]|uniref:Uncharacterized protein n=1 Tax=mine drainage metagenome TaxID=410659 RepID=A0A1J5QI53_9ZZZZ